MAVDGFDLSGKRALVAGGSAVARAITEALTSAGARVEHADLPAPEAADALVRQTVARLRTLDALVVCPDRRHAAPLVDLRDEEWDRLVAANLTTPLRLVRAAARAMLESGNRGRIILVHSVLAERGLPNTAAFGATQAALAHLVRALSLEWARTNLRINGIAVGWIEGDPLVPEADAQRLARYLASKRLGRADELGALAVYLASNAADMMTGQSIAVDGGAMIHA
jgi:NAD(P)-dependent dehydrogenase (short-subunit alcohol dehydrogenase family)